MLKPKVEGDTQIDSKIKRVNLFSITKLRKRLFAGVVAIVFLFLFVLAKSFSLCVVKGEALREKAIDQWTRELPVKAVRGDIYDKNGILLAGTAGTYCVYVRPRCVTDAERVSSVLSEELGADQENLLYKIKNLSSSEITVKRQVSEKSIKKLSEYSLNGVYFAPDNTRVYPFGDMLCQTLGYVSYDGVGQSGIEKYYDEFLRGINGEILYESDLVGSDIQGASPHYVEAQNGYSLNLTIDAQIQLICESAIKRVAEKYTPRRASALVMEPSCGKILAMCCYPSFDLNSVPRDDIEKLTFNGRNSIVCDSYEPGSTFKVVTASANIEEFFKGNAKAFSLAHVFNSSRYRIVSGRKIKCWSTHANGKHSNENLAAALNNSCNPIFVDIALSLGKDVFYEYLEKYNFGAATGIDMGGETVGMVLPKGSVTDGDLARIGFGQTIAVTQLQLAAAVAASINGGIYYQPYLLQSVTDGEKTLMENYPTAKNRVISTQASSVISSYLEDVVTSGSGKQAYIDGYRVGGKTGTAQKYENGAIAAGKYVMSFVGFFPADRPRYLALVAVDEPIGGAYGSTVAAPVCKEIFQGIIEAKDIKKAA